MRIKTLLPLLLVAIVAACGGNPGGTSGAKPATAGPGSTTPAGQVDCAAIETAGEQLIAIQLMAQLRNPETVASIRDKQIGNLDLDALLAALAVLHALDGYASPLGDPKAAIDSYETAAKAAKELFANEPITQAAIDAFNAENVGTVATFLGRQAAIAGAIGEAGC
jgi:hypothetical protein